MTDRKFTKPQQRARLAALRAGSLPLAAVRLADRINGDEGGAA